MYDIRYIRYYPTYQRLLYDVTKVAVVKKTLDFYVLQIAANSLLEYKKVFISNLSQVCPNRCRLSFKAQKWTNCGLTMILRL